MSRREQVRLAVGEVSEAWEIMRGALAALWWAITRG